MEGGPGSSVSQVVREGRLMPRPKPNHRGPRSPGTGQRDPLPAWASPVYWGSFWDAHVRWGCRATGSSVLRVRWGSTHFTSSVAARPLENAPAVGGGAPRWGSAGRVGVTGPSLFGDWGWELGHKPVSGLRTQENGRLAGLVDGAEIPERPSLAPRSFTEPG